MSEMKQDYKLISSDIISSIPEGFSNILKNMDLTVFLSPILNVLSDVKPSIKVSNFKLSKLSTPFEGYKEQREYIIADMKSITIREIRESIPLKVSMFYDLEIEDLSRIKIKGNGQLKIHRKDGELLIEAENIWDIEEVDEIEPDEPKEHSRLINLCDRIIVEFVVEIVILFLLKFLIL